MSMQHTPTDFPIMGCDIIASIPWAVLAPHEAQAQANHKQSLKTLADRGGLSVAEALAIIHGWRWGDVANCAANDRALINLVRAWRHEQRKDQHD
jgi:hypothetical protein